MRIKYYLRGLGLGIIFTVIIFSISGNNHNDSNKNKEPVENTENETNRIIEEDNTENIIKDEINTENTESSEIINSEAVNNTEAETLDENNEVGQQDISVQQDLSGQSSSQEQDIAEEPPVVEPQLVTITVNRGDYCRAVAQKLQDAGLVANGEDFRVYMGNIGYGSSIHNGDFQIPMGATYEEIANILVGK